MTQFWCVLKTGGDFHPRHVLRLLSQFTVYAPAWATFRCLTDNEELLKEGFARPLRHGWPGWFSKIELFRWPGPILYMDLDVNIIGDLAPLLEACEKHEFLICRSMQPDCVIAEKHVVNSTVMGWSGDVSRLYREFAEDPAGIMPAYTSRVRWQEPGRGWGDQGFVRDRWGKPWLFWQDVCPGAICHYKYGTPEAENRVVVSSSNPRPWDVGGADERIRKRGWP